MTRPPPRLPEDLCNEVADVLDDLGATRLDPAEWNEVNDHLGRLDAAIRCNPVDPAAVRAELTPLGNSVFRGKVHARLRRPGGTAAIVASTKRTPALPAVGLVCAVILLALGWALGGGVMLVATALFALFVLGIAVAGTRVNAERTEQRRADPATDLATPAPGRTLEMLSAVDSMVGSIRTRAQQPPP